MSHLNVNMLQYPAGRPAHMKPIWSQDEGPYQYSLFAAEKDVNNIYGCTYEQLVLQLVLVLAVLHRIGVKLDKELVQGRESHTIMTSRSWVDWMPKLLPFLLKIIVGLDYAPKASTTSSLDLCPDFMGISVGQASILYDMSQHFLPILEGNSVGKSRLRLGRFHFPIENRWERRNECIFRVITMGGRRISISWPCKLSCGRGTQIYTQSCVGLINICRHYPLCFSLHKHFLGKWVNYCKAGYCIYC